MCVDRQRSHTQVYLQYMNHVTQQGIVVVSRTDQLIVQRHHLKFMSCSENTQTQYEHQSVVPAVLAGI